jgi:uncharacterized protein
MELSRQNSHGRYHLQGYQAGSLRINGQRFAPPLWLTADILETAWPVALENPGLPQWSTLSAKDFAEIPPCDIVLLGTGNACQLPPAELYQALAEVGIILEVMDSAAACRTFAVLTSENRRVAAAFLA